MTEDIILIIRIIAGSNVPPDLLTISAIRLSAFVVANKTMAIIKQKEKDFLTAQDLNNIKNNTNRNIQNNGLRKEKLKFFRLSRWYIKTLFNV